MNDSEVKRFVLNRANTFLKSYDKDNQIPADYNRNNLLTNIVDNLEKQFYYQVNQLVGGGEQTIIFDHEGSLIYSINNLVSHVEYYFLKHLFLSVRERKNNPKLYRQFQTAFISMHVKT